jgi:hypothetical protein
VIAGRWRGSRGRSITDDGDPTARHRGGAHAIAQRSNAPVYDLEGAHAYWTSGLRSAVEALDANYMIFVPGSRKA